MAKKIGGIILTWVFVILAYIVLAVSSSTVQQLSSDTITTLDATSDMSNYPGSAEFIKGFPMFSWFIPGGVGIVATAVFLRKKD